MDMEKMAGCLFLSIFSSKESGSFFRSETSWLLLWISVRRALA
jgi:hypothetical protein